MSEPAEIPDVARIAVDAIELGDAKSVEIISPYFERRLILRKAIAALSPGALVLIRSERLGADLALEDDGRPSWEAYAKAFVDRAREDGRHPVHLAIRHSFKTSLPWSKSEFVEWFNTIAHTTPWPRAIPERAEWMARYRAF